MTERRRNTAMIAAVSLLALSLVALSPGLLAVLSNVAAADWNELADVGQTYGLASALLSAAAVAGVAYSITLQIRANRVMQLQAVRAMHLEIFRFAAEDPETYLACFGDFVASGRDRQWMKQRMYIIQRFRYIQAAYELGEINEWALRHEFAPSVLLSESGREWWSYAREAYLANRAGGSRQRVKLVRIIDEVYQELETAAEAKADPPSVAAPSTEPVTL